MNIPTLEGNLETVIGSLVDWLNDSIKKEPWTNEEIDEKFGRRSINQILDDESIFYMNSCLDYALVAYHALNQNGITQTLIVEELFDQTAEINSVHIAIEFLYGSNVYSLEFSTLNKVVVSKGAYENSREDIQSLRKTWITKKIGPDDVPSSLFDRETAKRMDSDYLRPIVERLKHDNTPETYQEYIEKLGEHRDLYLVVE